MGSSACQSSSSRTLDSRVNVPWPRVYTPRKVFSLIAIAGKILLPQVVTSGISLVVQASTPQNCVSSWSYLEAVESFHGATRRASLLLTLASRLTHKSILVLAHCRLIRAKEQPACVNKLVSQHRAGRMRLLACSPMCAQNKPRLGAASACSQFCESVRRRCHGIARAIGRQDLVALAESLGCGSAIGYLSNPTDHFPPYGNELCTLQGLCTLKCTGVRENAWGRGEPRLDAPLDEVRSRWEGISVEELQSVG